MLLSSPWLAPLLPIAVGAAAQASALHERADESPRGRARDPGLARGGTVDDVGRPERAQTAPVLAALCALLLYPLALPAEADRHALVLAALFAGALWLAGRSDEDRRLQPLFLCVAGIVVGARPWLGVALLPIALPSLIASLRRLDRGRAIGAATIVLGLGGAVGRFALGADDRHPAPPAAQAALAWLHAAAQAIGPAAFALSLAGAALALSSGTRRAALGATVLGALAVEAHAGSAGPLTALALSLGVGLAVIEAGARLAAQGLRGSELALLPLVLMVLVEPLSLRLATTRFSVPTLGPVPPRDRDPGRRHDPGSHNERSSSASQR